MPKYKISLSINALGRDNYLGRSGVPNVEGHLSGIVSKHLTGHDTSTAHAIYNSVGRCVDAVIYITTNPKSKDDIVKHLLSDEYLKDIITSIHQEVINIPKIRDTAGFIDEKSYKEEEEVPSTPTTMTNREFWLKLFNENDLALICAINLCYRFFNFDAPLTDEQLKFIAEKKEWLNKDVNDPSIIEKVFNTKR